MRFLGKRVPTMGGQPVWYSVVLYLSLTVIWFFLSRGIYGERLNFLELQIMLFCQSGFVAIVYVSRYLLFRDAGCPRFFKWAAGLFLFLFLGIKLSQGIQRIPSILGMPGIGPKLLFVFLEGLIFSIFLAWLAEIIFAIFRSWYRLPRLEAYASYQYWNRLWIEIVKLGLISTLLMILAYFYVINFLLVDTVLYSYILTVPVIVLGAGLFLLFFQKVSRWREEEIRTIDRELAPYIEWSKYTIDNQSDFKNQGVFEWVQYLQSIREYLCQMKRPMIIWWVIVVYGLFCAAVLCLPYLWNVVIEV